MKRLGLWSGDSPSGGVGLEAPTYANKTITWDTNFFVRYGKLGTIWL